MKWFRHRDWFDADQPDGLLLALAATPGYDPEAGITIRTWPADHNHGRHAVTWRQDGRQRTAEGNTLAAALRRATTATRPRSAKTSTKTTAP